MVVLLIGWCIYTLCCGILSCRLSLIHETFDSAPARWDGLRTPVCADRRFAILIALGIPCWMSGEESLARCMRIESPKLQTEEGGLGHFRLQLCSLDVFFSVMIIPDDARQHYLENLIGGLAMNLQGR